MRNFKSFRKLFVIGGIASVFFLQSCVIESSGSSGSTSCDLSAPKVISESAKTLDPEMAVVQSAICTAPSSCSQTVDYSSASDTEYQAYTFYGVSECNKICIQNASGHAIYAIYSNLNETSANTIAEGSGSGVAKLGTADLSLSSSSMHTAPKYVTDFNANAKQFLKKGSGSSLSAKSYAVTTGYNVGDAKNWYVDENCAVSSSTLRQKVELSAAPGHYVYVWVDNAEWGSIVTQSMVDRIASKFANDGYESKPSIYSMVTQMLGEPWGADAAIYNDIIPSTKADVHILYYDIPGKGYLGYFFSAHNYLRSAEIPFSNEELMFFMDSRFLKAIPDEMLNTLAHEFQHMVHFYQKGVRKNILTPTWLNEMMSMTIEDLTGYYITGSGPTNYLYSYYPNHTDDLALWNDSATDYYPVTAFGTFLVRHFGGSDLWTAMMNSTETDGFLTVSDAIQTVNGTGIPSYETGTADSWWKYAFINWGVSTVMDPDSSAYTNIPTGYGYPALTETSYYSSTYDLILPAYDIFDQTVLSDADPVIYSTPPSAINPMTHVAVELTSSAGANEEFDVNIGSDTVITYIVAP